MKQSSRPSDNDKNKVRGSLYHHTSPHSNIAYPSPSGAAWPTFASTSSHDAHASSHTSTQAFIDIRAPLCSDYLTYNDTQYIFELTPAELRWYTVPDRKLAGTIPVKSILNVHTKDTIVDKKEFLHLSSLQKGVGFIIQIMNYSLNKVEEVCLLTETESKMNMWVDLLLFCQRGFMNLESKTRRTIEPGRPLELSGAFSGVLRKKMMSAQGGWRDSFLTVKKTHLEWYSNRRATENNKLGQLRLTSAQKIVLATSAEADKFPCRSEIPRSKLHLAFYLVKNPSTASLSTNQNNPPGTATPLNHPTTLKIDLSPVLGPTNQTSNQPKQLTSTLDSYGKRANHLILRKKTTHISLPELSRPQGVYSSSASEPPPPLVATADNTSGAPRLEDYMLFIAENETLANCWISALEKIIRYTNISRGLIAGLTGSYSSIESNIEEYDLDEHGRGILEERQKLSELLSFVPRLVINQFFTSVDIPAEILASNQNQGQRPQTEFQPIDPATASVLSDHESQATFLVESDTSMAISNLKEKSPIRKRKKPQITSMPKATILFADISGFTPLAESLAKEGEAKGAEILSQHLNRYFSQLLEIIEKYGGDVIKFAGDALIASWTTDSVFTNVFLAAICAKEIQTRTKTYDATVVFHINESEDEERTAAAAAAKDKHGPKTSSSAPQKYAQQFYTTHSSMPATTHLTLANATDNNDDDENRGGANPLGTLLKPDKKNRTYYSAQKSDKNTFTDVSMSAPSISFNQEVAISLDAGMNPSDATRGTVSDPTGHSQTSKKTLSDQSSFAYNTLPRTKRVEKKLTLSLHIGISTGDVYGLNLGGVQGRWEYLLAGDTLSKVSEAEGAATSGEIVMDNLSWSFLKDSFATGVCINSDKLHAPYFLSKTPQNAFGITSHFEPMHILRSKQLKADVKYLGLGGPASSSTTAIFPDMSAEHSNLANNNTSGISASFNNINHHVPKLDETVSSSNSSSSTSNNALRNQSTKLNVIQDPQFYIELRHLELYQETGALWRLDSISKLEDLIHKYQKNVRIPSTERPNVATLSSHVIAGNPSPSSNPISSSSISSSPTSAVSTSALQLPNTEKLVQIDESETPASHVSRSLSVKSTRPPTRHQPSRESSKSTRMTPTAKGSVSLTKMLTCSILPSPPHGKRPTHEVGGGAGPISGLSREKNQELVRTFIEYLQSYIPRLVRHKIDIGLGKWMAELLKVTILFCKLPSLQFRAAFDAVKNLDTKFQSLQKIVYAFDGIVRQFIIDDKGCVLVVAFSGHDDDPIRGVKCGITMQSKLKCSVGVTTGKVFMGTVGSELRREFAMVGDTVNLAARLMDQARDNVFCDNYSYMASKTYKNHGLDFKALPPIRLKGKKNEIPIFTVKANPFGLDLSSDLNSSAFKKQPIIGAYRKQCARLIEEKFIELVNVDLKDPRIVPIQAPVMIHKGEPLILPVDMHQLIRPSSSMISTLESYAGEPNNLLVNDNRKHNSRLSPIYFEGHSRLFKVEAEDADDIVRPNTPVTAFADTAEKKSMYEPKPKPTSSIKKDSGLIGNVPDAQSNNASDQLEGLPGSIGYGPVYHSPLFLVCGAEGMGKSAVLNHLKHYLNHTKKSLEKRLRDQLSHVVKKKKKPLKLAPLDTPIPLHLGDTIECTRDILNALPVQVEIIPDQFSTQPFSAWRLTLTKLMINYLDHDLFGDQSSDSSAATKPPFSSSSSTSFTTSDGRRPMRNLRTALDQKEVINDIFNEVLVVYKSHESELVRRGSAADFAKKVFYSGSELSLSTIPPQSFNDSSKDTYINLSKGYLATVRKGIMQIEKVGRFLYKEHFDEFETQDSQSNTSRNFVYSNDGVDSCELSHADLEDIAEGIAKILLFLTGNKKQLVFCEEILKVDARSWDVLKQLKKLNPYTIVLVTLPSATDFTAKFGDPSAHFQTYILGLDELSKKETAELICYKSNAKSASMTVIDMLYTKCRGTPYYISQLTLFLLEQGSLLVDANKVAVFNKKIKTESDIKFPEKLSDAIISLIARLPAMEQFVLKVASVIGQDFGLNFGLKLLQMVYPALEDRYKIAACLADLEKKDLVLKVSSDFYKISQPIVADTCYNLLLFDQRIQLHRSIAEWYIDYMDCSADMYMSEIQRLEAIAYHFAKAEDLRALPYFMQAASLYLSEYNFVKTLDLYFKSQKLLANAVTEDAIEQFCSIETQKAYLFLLIGKFEHAHASSRLAIKMLVTYKASMDVSKGKSSTSSLPVRVPALNPPGKLSHLFTASPELSTGPNYTSSLKKAAATTATSRTASSTNSATNTHARSHPQGQSLGLGQGQGGLSSVLPKLDPSQHLFNQGTMNISEASDQKQNTRIFATSPSQIARASSLRRSNMSLRKPAADAVTFSSFLEVPPSSINNTQPFPKGTTTTSSTSSIKANFHAIFDSNAPSAQRQNSFSTSSTGNISSSPPISIAYPPSSGMSGSSVPILSSSPAFSAGTKGMVLMGAHTALKGLLSSKPTFKSAIDFSSGWKESSLIIMYVAHSILFERASLYISQNSYLELYEISCALISIAAALLPYEQQKSFSPALGSSSSSPSYPKSSAKMLSSGITAQNQMLVSPTGNFLSKRNSQNSNKLSSGSYSSLMSTFREYNTVATATHGPDENLNAASRLHGIGELESPGKTSKSSMFRESQSDFSVKSAQSNNASMSSSLSSSIHPSVQPATKSSASPLSIHNDLDEERRNNKIPQPSAALARHESDFSLASLDEPAVSTSKTLPLPATHETEYEVPIITQVSKQLYNESNDLALAVAKTQFCFPTSYYDNLISAYNAHIMVCFMKGMEAIATKYRKRLAEFLQAIVPGTPDSTIQHIAGGTRGGFGVGNGSNSGSGSIVHEDAQHRGISNNGVADPSQSLASSLLHLSAPQGQDDNMLLHSLRGNMVVYDENDKGDNYESYTSLFRAEFMPIPSIVMTDQSDSFLTSDPNSKVSGLTTALASAPVIAPAPAPAPMVHGGGSFGAITSRQARLPFPPQDPMMFRENINFCQFQTIHYRKLTGLCSTLSGLLVLSRLDRFPDLLAELRDLSSDVCNSYFNSVSYSYDMKYNIILAGDLLRTPTLFDILQDWNNALYHCCSTTKVFEATLFGPHVLSPSLSSSEDIENFSDFSSDASKAKMESATVSNKRNSKTSASDHQSSPLIAATNSAFYGPPAMLSPPDLELFLRPHFIDFFIYKAMYYFLEQKTSKLEQLVTEIFYLFFPDLRPDTPVSSSSTNPLTNSQGPSGSPISASKGALSRNANFTNTNNATSMLSETSISSASSTTGSVSPKVSGLKRLAKNLKVFSPSSLFSSDSKKHWLHATPSANNNVNDPGRTQTLTKDRPVSPLVEDDHIDLENPYALLPRSHHQQQHQHQHQQQHQQHLPVALPDRIQVLLLSFSVDNIPLLFLLTDFVIHLAFKNRDSSQHKYKYQTYLSRMQDLFGEMIKIYRILHPRLYFYRGIIDLILHKGSKKVKKDFQEAFAAAIPLQGRAPLEVAMLYHQAFLLSEDQSLRMSCSVMSSQLLKRCEPTLRRPLLSFLQLLTLSALGVTELSQYISPKLGAECLSNKEKNGAL